MQRLLDFLYQKREIALFLVLQFVCAWLLVNYNNRYNASFFNSSNELSASISQSSADVNQYFNLSEVNHQLMLENEALFQQVQKLKVDSGANRDTLGMYRVIGAKVINNTFNRSTNFMTISVGNRDSVEVGMGVISPFGVVGQVKSVTNNFATVYSLLHPKLLISSKIKKSNTQCTVQWDQVSHDQAALKYIPRHIQLNEGDTVVTSGFNSVFPEGILIGVVGEIQLEEYMTFYDARIKLMTDFTSLYQVFVIKDLLKTEKDSLQVP